MAFRLWAAQRLPHGIWSFDKIPFSSTSPSLLSAMLAHVPEAQSSSCHPSLYASKLFPYEVKEF